MLVVAGLAAVAAVVVVLAVAVGFVQQVGVKSHGTPIGRVLRAGQQFGVLIQIQDPFIPSLKGRSESDMSYSYALWLIPETGDGGVRIISLAQGVRSGSRTHNIGAQHFENGVVWLTIDAMQGIEVDSGKKTTSPVPASLTNLPFSTFTGDSENPLEYFRASAAKLPSGAWLFLANDDELARDLKPGKRLYDNPTAERGLKPRRFYMGAEAPGVIPTLASTTPLGTQEFKSGAIMRSTNGGEPIRFTNPDGFLVVHYAGDVVNPTVHFSRVNIDGSIAWTADTKIGRLTQILPHETLPAFVGELVPTPNNLIAPTLVVLHLSDGSVKTTSLKGPVN